jgi:hypothetical protein
MLDCSTSFPDRVPGPVIPGLGREPCLEPRSGRPGFRRPLRGQGWPDFRRAVWLQRPMRQPVQEVRPRLLQQD